MKQNTTENRDALIHDIIDSVQSSIDIADRTSRKKYNFSIAELEVKMTLNFEIKEDESNIKSAAKPKHWLSLFSRSKAPPINTTSDNSADNKGTMTLRMLFKPGGKLLGAGEQPTTTAADSSGTDTSLSTNTSGASAPDDDL